MQVVLERIAAWEAAGLIDPETALRLRATEDDAQDALEPGRPRGQSTVGQIVGPAVTIGEMFAYLGGAFVLGAVNLFLTRAFGFDAEPGMGLAVGYGLVALVLVIAGAALATGDARRRRAGGVLFAVAVGQVAAAGVALTGALDVAYPLAGVMVAAAATIVAVALRMSLPALTTQATLLASLTGLAAAMISVVEDAFVPDPVFTDMGNPLPTGGPNPILIIVASAAWWLGFAALLGILGLIEARSGDDPASARRAALTRLWAGITAVAGLAAAVTMSGHDTTTGEFGRYLEPWVGDLALIVLAAILVERAFRRGANSFVYAAALALVIALTDFNVSYLTDTTEAGLLVEGLILLGAGFAVSRLRQRIGGDAVPTEGASLPAPA
jgi:hypothetical protein